MGGNHGVQHGIRLPLVRDIERVGKNLLVRMDAKRCEISERGM